MTTASKIQIEKVINLIEGMYMAGDVTFDGTLFYGSFDCELGDGLSAAMDWTCSGRTANIDYLGAYDEKAEEDVDFDAEALKSIAREIERISSETLSDALYERDLQKTVEGFYC